MKLALTCAVRLVRADLDRLGALHQRQCAIAVGGARIERGLEGDGGSGLVYVRVALEGGGRETYEGWFLDARRFPDRDADPQGGALFPTGSLVPWERGWPGNRLGARIRVDVPDPPEPAPMALEVAHARRYTLGEVRVAPAPSRLQLLHALRPARAPLHDVETMEEPDALGVLYDFVDLGPGIDVASLPASVRAHKRSGLVFLRLRSREDGERAFEGWFWDKLRHPSARSVPRDGRLFVAGSLVPTGVCLERSRVRLEPGRRLKDAERLAAGFAQLAAMLRVSVAGR